MRAVEDGTGEVDVTGTADVVRIPAAHPQLFAVPAVHDPLAYRFVKRLIDLTVSASVMLLLSPLFLLTVIAVRLDSRGPAIFSQQRVRGRRLRNPDGTHSWATEAFTLHKLRTMTSGADDEIHRTYMAAYLQGDEGALHTMRPDRKDGEHFRPANDPRVTRIGRILRTTSLDELPQLWNVFKGDMSLVGPRPPMPYEVEMYQERHLPRLAVKPGITGLAQVHGRAGIGFEDTVAWDIEYLTTRSLWLDLKVIVLTVPAVLSARGAG